MKRLLTCGCLTILLCLGTIGFAMFAGIGALVTSASYSCTGATTSSSPSPTPTAASASASPSGSCVFSSNFPGPFPTDLKAHYLCTAAESGTPYLDRGVATNVPPACDEPLFSDIPPGGFATRDTAGNCTWWTTYNYPTYAFGNAPSIPHLGNAVDWYQESAGYRTENLTTPMVGAAVIFGPGYNGIGPNGHVAVVVAVDSASFIVVEMNYMGLYKVDVRRVLDSNPGIIGFIYRPNTVATG